MMHMCGKCSRICGWLFLIVGILFLLVDFGVWGFSFWGIQWWTALFVLLGLGCIGYAKCPECQAMAKKR